MRATPADTRGASRPLLPAGVAFHERLAAGWSGGYRAGSFRKRLACFNVVLRRNVKAAQTWLDLGCGTGVLTAELLALEAAAIAMDGSPAMLSYARAAVTARPGLPLGWLQGDVQSLPLADSAFDGIVCSSVIEYADRPAAVLREAARTLRTGGKLVLSVPPRYSAVRTIQKLIRRLAGWSGCELFGYLSLSRFEIDPARLSAWCGDAGFVVEQVTKFDPYLPRIALAILRPALLIVEAVKQ